MPLPFLLRRSWESRAGFSISACRGHLLYASPFRKPHSPLPGCSGGTGASASPSRKQESRGAFPSAHAGSAGASAPLHRKWGSRAGFSPEPAGATVLWLAAPEPSQSIAGAVGLWTLPHHTAGNGSRAIKEKSGGSFLRFSDSRQDYLVPKIRSPASPRPGMMYLCSSRWSSREAQ